MWYTVWYALGILTGIYITSIRFRIRFNKSFDGFVAWVKGVVERNKEVKRLQAEIETLRQSTGTIKVRSHSRIINFFRGL